MTTESLPAKSRHPLLIPLAALAAVLPLIVHGCSCGHDYDFHLLNWMEAARQFSHGNLNPHWAFSPAYDAGEPRFVFYPPLSWMLGALLGLLLTHLPGVSEAAGWSAAPVVFTWIALTASGLTMYRLARMFAGTNAALLAAALYLANPYMLFTAYERTAYGELLAAAWIPLLLHAVLEDKITIPRIAVPVALLWLTNAPAAVMGSYALALLGVIRIAFAYRLREPAALSPASAMGGMHGQPPLQLATRIVGGGALGLGLAAFYIVPAAYERRFVQIAMATVAGMRIDQNILFEHTGTSSDALLHDQVLHTASVIAVLLLAATAIALAIVFLQRKLASSGRAFPTLPLAMFTAGIAFMLTPLSLPVWNHAPQAAFLQFTWRLLALVAPVLALAMAAALSGLRLKFVATAFTSVLLAAALTLPEVHVFRQPCDDEDTAPARLALFQSGAGADPTDEYTPTGADNDALKQNDPPYWLADSAEAAPPAAAQPGPAPMHFSIAAPHVEDLILNLRDYPAWRITLDGAVDPVRERRKDGLIAIPIAAGTSTIDIRYAHTHDETTGDAITLLAFAVFFFTLRTGRTRPTS
jgi:hypothetical protein